MIKQRTLPLKSGLSILAKCQGDGNEFVENHVRMVITGIGLPYKVGRRKMI